jgi:peptide/nickel transport system permease protein
VTNEVAPLAAGRTAAEAAPVARRRPRLGAQIGRIARRNPSLVAGVVVVGALALLSLLGPLAYPVDPLDQELRLRLAPPVWAGGSWAHPLGADGFGRDTLSRILHGGRVSLGVSAAAILVAGLIGVPLGLAAGYLGGFRESFIMRLADAQQALPGVLLAIIVVAVVGASVTNLVVVLAISGWSVYTRLVYGMVRSLRARDFVLAAETIGASSGRVMRRHVLPNTWTSILVLATLQVGRMIQAEAALSFLGLGVPPPDPSWGSMLSDGQKVILSTPWVAAIPGIVIVVAVLGVNLLGDGLRRQIDPRLRVL